jgi:Peptidase inhibitor family I36
MNSVRTSKPLAVMSGLQASPNEEIRMRNAKLIAPILLMVAAIVGLATAPANAEAVATPSRAQILEQLQRPATNMQELQQQIDLQLKLAPGGKQTSVNEVSYDGGRFVVTYALPNAITGYPDCPSGWFCFYDGYNWGYPRGRLSSCGWQDLAWWGWNDRTNSIDNSTGSWIQYIQHWDYGNPANGHRYDYTLFWNDPWAAYSSVPYPNMADHVSRYC